MDLLVVKAAFGAAFVASVAGSLWRTLGAAWGPGFVPVVTPPTEDERVGGVDVIAFVVDSGVPAHDGQMDEVIFMS